MTEDEAMYLLEDHDMALLLLLLALLLPELLEY